MRTKTLDRRYLGRFSHENIEIVRTKDSFIFDPRGKRYIDFMMGWCVGNFGWGNSEIRKNIKISKSPEYVNNGFLYRPWAELGELLISIAPGKLKKCFRSTGGTEAVDGALQLSMLYTNRSKFISIEGSYHGNSLATWSIGSSTARKKYGNLLVNCFKVEPPLNTKLLKHLETLLKNKDIAAFIMEPIICNLNVLIPEYEFMQSLQKLCKKYGTLLIMDEVASGFGRTGKIFACEHFGISPDIMTLGKALSAGFGAIGAILTTEEIADATQEDFTFYSTYGWHPFSVDAAIATLKFLKKNKVNILAHVNEMNTLFIKRLQNMKFKKLKNLNSIGLAFGIELGDADYVKRIKNSCKRKGLIIGAEETSFLLFPSLTIDPKTAETGLDILERSL